MRIAVAQIESVVGDFDANIARIKESYKRACSEQARLLLTPELSVCGYPLYDLMDRPEMIERNERALSDLMTCTKGQKTALIVGHVAASSLETGRLAQNCASVLENGQVVFTQAKSLLPTYDVFDEARYFEPASQNLLWNCDGIPVAIAICEDLWAHQGSRLLYSRDPVQAYCDQKAQLVLSLSSSPYEWGKRFKREELHQNVALRVGAPLVYVNQRGATDEILFDGGSFVMDRKGKVIHRLPYFQSETTTFDLSNEAISSGLPEKISAEIPEEIEILARGLVTGIREYFSRTGFKKAILGLSGGIDSAVVAALAVRALGSDQVMGVAMPSQYSSSHSLEDAEILSRNLGISLEVRPIKFLFSMATREISEKRGQLADVALENLQSRLRGLILMTLSNHESALVLTTGNKSELAMGYCTLTGDMVGALAPIGDLFKTRVYDLARHLNEGKGSTFPRGVIPERSITKPPSAELRPNQTDQESLPPYEELDSFLFDYLERGLSVSELEAKHKEIHTKSVKELLRSVEINEYKRRQSAIILKVSSKAFGIGRRIPVAKRWEQR